MRGHWALTRQIGRNWAGSFRIALITTVADRKELRQTNVGSDTTAASQQFVARAGMRWRTTWRDRPVHSFASGQNRRRISLLTGQGSAPGMAGVTYWRVNCTGPLATTVRLLRGQYDGYVWLRIPGHFPTAHSGKTRNGTALCRRARTEIQVQIAAAIRF